jgi:hypothetical protein
MTKNLLAVKLGDQSWLLNLGIKDGCQTWGSKLAIKLGDQSWLLHLGIKVGY